MIWPMKRAGREPKESELAKAQAEQALKDTVEDRHAVRAVVSAIEHELAQNHISERIGVLLKEQR